MNFKVNLIEKDVECKTALFEELNLLYGKVTIGDRSFIVFDATKYCISIEIEFNIRQFMQLNARQLNIIAKDSGLDCNELFFISNNGSVYIIQEMSVLFLSSVDATLFAYFNEMIFDLLQKGVAISDKKIMELVMDRVPNETLEQIIESRNEKEK